jgi:hypothetical protein
MIHVNRDGTLNASVSGLVVYLDNWAIGALAEKNPPRRARFMRCIHAGADLLFSVANAAELSGPRGKSANDVRSFLDELGPHWFPTDLNTIEIVKQETSGVGREFVRISRDFLMDYLAFQVREYTPGSGKVIPFSGELFRLGAVVDWVGPQRDSILSTSIEMDAALRKRIARHTQQAKKSARWLDENLPAIPFHPERPAFFAFRHLMRILVRDGGPLKKNDGLDFSHAVIGTAFANFAALDKGWRHRVAGIPTPHRLARVYSASELDTMVEDIESAVDSAQVAG